MGHVLRTPKGTSKAGHTSGILEKTKPAGNSGIAGEYNKAGKAEGRDASNMGGK